MIGSHSVGSRWLGSGRAQLPDYIELSGSFELHSDLSGDVRAGKALSASFAASSELGGQLRRLRGMSCSLRVGTDLAGDTARIRPMSASFDAGTDLQAQLARIRPMGASMSVSTDLQARTGRLRKISGSFSFATTLSARVSRLRGMAASMQMTIGMVASALRGRSMSASFVSVARLTITEIRTFFNPAHARRRITVDEKDRFLEIAARDRVIVFESDDEALSMEEKVKQPREVVDYEIDMRRYFRSIPEDFITQVDLEIDIQGDPDDLEIGPGSQPDWVPVGDPIHQAKIWVGGGRDGQTYKVTALVTTNRGRVEEVDFLILVEEQ